MNAEVKIRFLNHACVQIMTDTVTVVSDPWFSGSIFNKGWSSYGLQKSSSPLRPIPISSGFRMNIRITFRRIFSDGSTERSPRSYFKRHETEDSRAISVNRASTSIS